MMRVFAVVCAAAVIAFAGATVPADAGSSKSGAKHRKAKAKSYRGKGPQVRGYQARRGGYSYSVSDVINTYGDSRTNYGSASVYRDPMLDRQSRFGPFDHGFFFDSGISPRGGNSPYHN